MYRATHPFVATYFCPGYGLHGLKFPSAIPSRPIERSLSRTLQLSNSIACERGKISSHLCGLSSNLACPLSSSWQISRVSREMQRTRALRHAAVNGAKRAVTELSHYPRAGEKLHGFTLLRSKHVPELELTALHLQHDKTGAEHLHIARDDSNNVFSIGFKTNPPDDTGVPHILEHTTLCGSEK